MAGAAAALHRVFVYGTLRGGGSNHFRMAGGLFLMRATVKGRLFRIDWYPGLVLGGGGTTLGEVFEVTTEILRELDEFEGSEYRRVLTDVSHGEMTIRAWVWEWLGPVDEARHIASGDWLE